MKDTGRCVFCVLDLGIMGSCVGIILVLKYMGPNMAFW